MRLLMRNSVGAIIGIVIGLLIGYLWFRLPDYDFSGLPSKVYAADSLSIPYPTPVPYTQAVKALETYRNRGAMVKLALNGKYKMSGVLHSIDGIKYLHDELKKFASTHQPKENCVWELGFYPNIINDPKKYDKPRLNIYFIPTMYDTLTGTIYDYMDSDDSIRRYYRHNNVDNKKGENFAWDQGTIFP